jgi:hypothetical protein
MKERTINMKGILLAALFAVGFSAHASVCRIAGAEGSWRIELNGQLYALKGVGCPLAVGKNGTDYFELAREMGANTLRTWGTDQGTSDYLDRAREFGFMVDAGIWLPHCNWRKRKKVFSYVEDREALENLERETLEYVRRFRDHPAILFWNLGNEVLFFTNEENERIAFCRFLEKLVKRVKEIDPDHPVLYTAANPEMISYLRRYVPSLTLYGFNTYGGVDYIHEAMRDAGIRRPFLITEAGPFGPWQCPRDRFDRAVDQADYEKAFRYRYLLEEIDRFRGHCLGGFVFHLGETTQESLTWWNLTVGPLRREGYHAVKSHYTGRDPENRPPLCTALEIMNPVVRSGERVVARVAARDREDDPLRYSIKVGTARENILLHTVNEEVPVEVRRAGCETVFLAPPQSGIYKLHVFVYDGMGNIATRTASFKVE